MPSLKSKLDKLDVDEPTPADLSKLKDVVKNKLLKRLYTINWFKRLMLFKLTKTVHDTKIDEIENT